MKRVFLFAGLVLTLAKSYGQKYASPTYVPPSPMAQSFKLYGDIPVSYSTGVPDVSIPIYTIQAGEFSFPITLRYHLKSVKPGSKSNVALGWTLDYGGMVSRTIYDRADNGTMLTYSGYESGGTGSTEELKDIAKPVNGPDSEYDIFNYNLNSGEGGEFIITSYSYYSGNTYTQLGRKSVKIAGGSSGSLGDFNLTTDKGVLYKFGYDKYQKSYSAQDYGVPSSWLLSQVVFPNNKAIDFSYEDLARFTMSNAQNKLTIYNDNRQQVYNTGGGLFGGGSCSSTLADYTVTGSSYDVEYDEKNIKQIDFTNGKIVFTLSSDKKIITGAKVYNLGKLIQEYQFVLSSNATMGEMKLLEKIVVKDKNAGTVNEYNFQYNNPTYGIDQNATVDYWGYYNNGGNAYRGFRNGQYAYTNNTQAGPPQTSYWTISSSQSKDASSECMINTLKKVIYPTKGETEFVYELNELSAGVFGSGPRVKQIINRDGNNTTVIKSYAYAIPENQYIPNIEDYCRANFDITNCTYGEGQGAVRTTTRTYDNDVTSRLAASLLECHYDKVTETIGDNVSVGGHDIGRNVYYFMQHPHMKVPIYNPAGGPANVLYKYKGWSSDLLYKKETYKAGETTTPLTVDTYNYAYHEDGEVFKNTVVNKLTEYPTIAELGDPDPYADNDIYQRDFMLNDPTYVKNTDMLTDVYVFYNYDIVPGWLELQNESHSENTPSGTIVSTTSYEYSGAQNYFPSAVTTTKSDGTSSVVENTYPYDYSSTEPYQTMISRNIIAPAVLQKFSTRNGGTTTLLRATKTNYYNWGSGIIQPVTVQAATGTSALSNLETRIRFDGYDEKGNVTAGAKAGDIQKAFLWGYNKNYLVAEITGATLSAALATPTFDTAVIQNVNGTYTDAQVRTELNKIRSYLSSAQITTYTYDPLIGLTSQTDINGRTTYYEYDAAGRLSLVRDKDGNIVKKIKYNYSGQAED